MKAAFAGGRANPGEHVVEASRLTKRFGTSTAVAGIDLAVGRGRVFGLLGPNGAGKTTTLRMLLGLATPSEGRLEVLGLPMPARRREVRRRLGVVPQADNLDPDLTVAENLAVYASYFGLSARHRRHWIEETLRLVQLEERAGSPIAALSGGMKRRLSLARALTNDPELLVLDEPTTGLDPQVRHLIWSRLRELARRGKTLVLTTHYMEEAERLCDDLAVMDGGQIVARGSPAELIAGTVEPYVVEVRGQADDVASRLGDLADLRTEGVGEMVYCYTADPRPAVRRLQGMPFLERPANLEDVFLQLTGRDLRD